MLPRTICLLAALSAAGAAVAAPRDIKFVEVDFVARTITLRNTGAAAESLDAWRFCSHDLDEVRRYSSPSALNGITLAPGDTLTLHYENDAPKADAFAVNVSSLGNVAGDLLRSPYAIQIYFPPTSFGNGNQIADHIQWSLEGLDDEVADERSDEAEAGGVWEDQTLWIETSKDSLSITLNEDRIPFLPHAVDDYTVSAAPTPCNAADSALPIGQLDIADVTNFLQLFGAMNAGADHAKPFGAFDIADVIEFLRLFGDGCP
ncbi:MAG: hypothetical protein CMJ31_14580 [Phycisphaerae bacterium]|nr:hypothetical protein [Phycisphaerae bacterium]